MAINLNLSGKVLIYLFSAFLGGFAAVLPIFIGKDGYLSAELAKILFPVLIQVNATVIGFWGIIFVYSLKILFDYRKHILDVDGRLLEKVEKMEIELKKSTDNDKQLEHQMISKWNDSSRECSEVYDLIGTKLNEYVTVGMAIVCCYIFSILMCILSIGLITDVGIDTLWITVAITPLVVGIGCSFAGYLTFTPKS